MRKGEQDATWAVDPKLAERPAGPATPFVPAARAGVAASVLPPPEGTRPVPIATEVVLWRMGGALRVTVVVKASFAMLAEEGDRAGAPRVPEPFHAADVHHKNQPMTHVVAASDRVPWKVAVDVTLVGHAHAPGGAPVTESKARFALLQGGSAVIDKTVRVVGDRSGPSATPAPFAKMPLVYQRALGGAPVNPIGCSGDDDEQPNVLDPADPLRPVCLGPIPGAWPVRSRLLGDTPRRELDAPTMELPRGFAFPYFQSAPADQQIAELAPGALVVLTGLHPEHERVDFELPGARAAGAVYGLDDADPDAPSLLRFRADTLHVDADRWIATVTWRALVDLRDSDQLRGLLVATGVGTGGVEPSIPARRPEPTGGLGSLASLGRSVPRPPAAPTGTLALPTTGAPAGATLPFASKDATLFLSTDDPRPAAVAPDAPRAAAILPDLSTARGAPERVAPPARSPEPPRPEEEVGLERYAEVCGCAASQDQELGELLLARDLALPLFLQAERHWQRVMALESKGGGRALRDRFDDAYVAAWEASQPDRFGPPHYARLLAAERAGLLHVELAEQGLDGTLGTRLRRVWRRRIAPGGPLADAVKRALAEDAGG